MRAPRSRAICGGRWILNKRGRRHHRRVGAMVSDFCIFKQSNGRTHISWIIPSEVRGINGSQGIPRPHIGGICDLPRHLASLHGFRGRAGLCNLSVLRGMALGTHYTKIREHLGRGPCPRNRRRVIYDRGIWDLIKLAIRLEPEFPSFFSSFPAGIDALTFFLKILK